MKDDYLPGMKLKEVSEWKFVQKFAIVVINKLRTLINDIGKPYVSSYVPSNRNRTACSKTLCGNKTLLEREFSCKT